MPGSTIRRVGACALIAMFMFAPTLRAQESAPNNPKYVYFNEGKPVFRGLMVGDAVNWSTAVENLTGKSSGGKVIVSPTKDSAGKDAMKVDFTRKKIKGQVALYGENIDISSVRDITALTIDMKILKRPTSSVSIGMDCNYPCRAEVQVRDVLKEYPTDQWIILPIPLDCFSSDNFDLKKINGPFVLSTEGQFEVEIGKIRLERMPADMKTCKSATTSS